MHIYNSGHLAMSRKDACTLVLLELSRIQQQRKDGLKGGHRFEEDFVTRH